MSNIAMLITNINKENIDIVIRNDILFGLFSDIVIEISESINDESKYKQENAHALNETTQSKKDNGIYNGFIFIIEKNNNV